MGEKIEAVKEPEIVKIMIRRANQMPNEIRMNLTEDDIRHNHLIEVTFLKNSPLKAQISRLDKPFSEVLLDGARTSGILNKF